MQKAGLHSLTPVLDLSSTISGVFTSLKSELELKNLFSEFLVKSEAEY